MFYLTWVSVYYSALNCMRKLLLIFILFKIPLLIVSQTNDKIIDSLEKIVKNYLTEDTVRIIQMTRLETYYYNNHIDKFGTYIKDIKEGSLKLNYNKGVSRSYFYGSIYEQLKGNYLQALDEVYKSIEYAKKDNLYSQLAHSYGQLTMLLTRNTNIDDNTKNKREALYYAELGLDNALKSKHQPTIHNLLIKNILLSIDINDISKAKVLIKKTKENAIETRDSSNFLDLSIQEGSINNKEGKYKEALQVLFKAKQRYIKYAPILEGLIDGHIADAYYKLKDFKSAELFYKKSVEENSLVSPDIQLSLLQSAKEFFKETKDYKNGLYYSDKYYHLKDSVSKISNLHDFNELMIKYNTALKDNENQELRHQNRIKDKNLIFTISSLILFGVGLLLLIFLYRKLLNTKIKIDNLNHSLKMSNQNKDVIFKIVSHDLKMPVNNLVILTQKFDNDIKSINQELLKDYSKKMNLIAVDTVETVNNLLYWSNNEANKSIFIEKIYLFDCVHDVLDTFKINIKLLNKNILINCDNKDISLDFNRVQFLTLLKNFISNAIKYSDSENGIINIRIIRESNRPIIIIEDNGKGDASYISRLFFQGESQILDTHLSGMGYKICKEIVNKFSLKIEFSQSETYKGLAVKIYF